MGKVYGAKKRKAVSISFYLYFTENVETAIFINGHLDGDLCRVKAEKVYDQKSQTIQGWKYRKQTNLNSILRRQNISLRPQIEAYSRH